MLTLHKFLLFKTSEIDEILQKLCMARLRFCGRRKERDELKTDSFNSLLFAKIQNFQFSSTKTFFEIPAFD